jgi:DUF2911 family protein
MRIGLSSLVVLGGLLVCGGARAQDGNGGVQAFAGDSARISTRIFFFKGQSSPGQFSIDYAQPEWKDEYDSQFDAMTKGKRIRFGKDFWTTLDTNMPIQIAGKDVAPGHYYCALERSKDDKWSLILLDPKTIQASKTDAFQTSGTTGGNAFPLAYEANSASADKLTVKLQPGDLDPAKAKLVITWGKHKLTAPIVAQISST